LIEKSELARIAGFIAERGGVLLVDEIYQGLVYGAEPWSAWACRASGADQQLLEVLCMTGWRLGWVVLRRVQCAASRSWRNTCSSPPRPLAARRLLGLPARDSFDSGRAKKGIRTATRFLSRRCAARTVDPGGAARRVLRVADCGRDAKRFSLDLLQKEAVRRDARRRFRRERHGALSCASPTRAAWTTSKRPPSHHTLCSSPSA